MTTTPKIVTQNMLDHYFKYKVYDNISKEEDVLSTVIKTDIKLTDVMIGTSNVPDSIGTKVILRNNLFSSTKTISAWASEEENELKMIEIVVLSATVNKYIKLNNRTEEQQQTKVLGDPEQLVVVLESKSVLKGVTIDSSDETGNETKNALVLRNAQLSSILEADCYGRTISMSRSQYESEGMIFQLSSDELKDGWNNSATSVLTRIYFEIPQAMISPDILVVNVELGIRAIRQSPTPGS